MMLAGGNAERPGNSTSLQFAKLLIRKTCFVLKNDCRYLLEMIFTKLVAGSRRPMTASSAARSQTRQLNASAKLRLPTGFVLLFCLIQSRAFFCFSSAGTHGGLPTIHSNLQGLFHKSNSRLK